MEWPQEALRSVATHFLQKACMLTRHTTDLQMCDSLGCRCPVDFQVDLSEGVFAGVVEQEA